MDWIEISSPGEMPEAARGKIVDVLYKDEMTYCTKESHYIPWDRKLNPVVLWRVNEIL